MRDVESQLCYTENLEENSVNTFHENQKNQYFTISLKMALKLIHVPISVAAHVGSVVDYEDVHPGGVVESSEELGSEEEVLRAADVTGGLHQQLKHQPLVASIHALVDLIHTPEQINSLENILSKQTWLLADLNGTDVSCCRANM